MNYPSLLEHHRDPPCRGAREVLLQMGVKCASDTIHRVDAAYPNPPSSPQQIGYFLQRSPRQWSPRFLFTEQEDKPLGCVPGDRESPTS